MRVSTVFFGFPVITICFLLSSNALYSQTALLSLASGTAVSGGAVSLNLYLTAQGGTAPAGLQFTLSYPASAVASVGLAAGPALSASGKGLTCAARNGSTICVGVGLNSNAIASGVAAVVTVSLSPFASGSVAISTEEVVAADSAGNLLPLAASGGVISVQSSTAVTLSSVSVSGFSLIGGTNVGVTVTLTGSIPGAVIVLTGSNAAFPSTSVIFSGGGNAQTFSLPTLPVAIATSVTVTASYNNTFVVSPPFTLIPAAAPVGTATFVKTDTSTAGRWKGVYGGEGYNVINYEVNYPAYAAVNPINNYSYMWANSTVDPRALQKPSGTDNVAAAWFSPGVFSIDLNFQDSATHQVALYLLDWDNYFGRVERIDILNTSDALLDSRTVTSFVGGQYLVWNLTGHVVVRITNLNPDSNAVISGIFFGGGGSTSAAASFVKTDATTGGQWKGVYGGDGFNVIGDIVKYPSYVSVNPSGQFPLIWENSTTDPRALQKASSTTDNIAACWYTLSSFSIDLNFTDTAAHQVALYLLDWDNYFGRVEGVEILDSTGAVLDSRTVSNFAGGQYLVWNLRGHVMVRITNSNSNAVISGIFFGGGSSISAR